MSRVIIDIETAGYRLEELDKETQEYLLRYANTEIEEQKVREGLSFYPLTAQVVAIGMLNPDTDKGVVYYQLPHSNPPINSDNHNTEGHRWDTVYAESINTEPFEEEGITYEGGTEREILERFWSVVDKYDQVITFNGRTFDGPFLTIRSMIHRIRPTRNLIPNRYGDEHIDLLDRLTFFGISRRFNLDTWCRALGIKSPKSEDLNGYMVPEFFRTGRSLEVAKYCALDLRATKELFHLWQQYIPK